MNCSDPRIAVNDHAVPIQGMASRSIRAGIHDARQKGIFARPSICRAQIGARRFPTNGAAISSEIARSEAWSSPRAIRRRNGNSAPI